MNYEINYLQSFLERDLRGPKRVEQLGLRKPVVWVKFSYNFPKSLGHRHSEMYHVILEWPQVL